MTDDNKKKDVQIICPKCGKQYTCVTEPAYSYLMTDSKSSTCPNCGNINHTKPASLNDE